MARNQSASQPSDSPSPPPWSPISPDTSTAALADVLDDHSVSLPPNVPISESTNTDIIALRAALGVLQMQRLQSIRNIQTLDTQRKLALAHPDEFRKGLVDRTIRSQQEVDTIFDEEDSQAGNTSTTTDEKAPPSPLKEFGSIPSALHIVRCPPVNWSKYHVAGEILDQLHEQQRRVPDSGHVSQPLPSRPHTIAAPYSPWHDKITEATQTTKTSGT